MKAIVLSSGGVDSTTCLAMAVHELGKENVVTLSFEYGQRHSKELDSAQKVADYYGVRHVVFNLRSFLSATVRCYPTVQKSPSMKVMPIRLLKRARAKFLHTCRLETV